MKSEDYDCDPIGLDDDDEEWSNRGSFWLETKRSRTVRRKAGPLARQPLVLTGHGMNLRISHGALEVQNGFTHYPQRRESWRIFSGDPARPSRIVVLDGSGAVTFDVLAWLAEQNILLIQLDYRGRVVNVVGPVGIAADPKLIQAQLAAAHPRRALQIASWLIQEKISRSLATVAAVIPPSSAKTIAIEQLKVDESLLARRPATTQQELLGIEGRSAQFYFRSWYGLPIRWKGTGRRPVPDKWLCVGPRTSARNQKNHWASHPVHAMLNYGYAVLESQVRIELMRVGLDSAIGMMHAARPGRPALVLDVMEPGRPMVDRAVLGFALAQTFSPGDFAITPEGVCRLHPQLARRLVGEIGSFEWIRAIVAELVQRVTVVAFSSKGYQRQRRRRRQAFLPVGVRIWAT
jgi:CRISPR-associated endonuclease Cas1